MQELDLSGTWRICSSDAAFDLTGKVPGSLFADLETAGHFGPEGLNWRENNRACLQIADRDFTWSREFSLSDDFLSQQDDRSIFLETDGLDTLAAISINGKSVATTANMHRRFRFCVDGLLRPGENRIEIRFGNALEFCRQEKAHRALWHAYQPSPEIAFGGFNTIRKSHCSFGWDWGPIVPDVGIWRPIRLVRYEAARIADLRVIQAHQNSQGKTEVELTIKASIEYLVDGGYSITRPPANLTSKIMDAVSAAFSGGGEIRLRGSLRLPNGTIHEFALDTDGNAQVLVKNPELWWPNGLGQQPLYAVRVDLLQGHDTIHSQSLKLGLRTLTIRRETDTWGESFEFVVNGLPFFARGADYIPQDTSLSRVSPVRTEGLIQDAVAANFNCLRVWGGAVYPDDGFFDLCDRYGLVVWQDLMFACALYDVRNPEFRENVLEEVRDNLRRIRHHACLGLICGNNEMELAFVEWNLPDVPATRSEYLLQYQYHFPRIVAELCPEVFYWPASPSSGGDFANPNDPDRGDCHFWTVWHGGKDFSEYSRHYFRFMSEFGFESFPALKTIHEFTLPEDRNIFSPVMEDHQRCVGGNAKILDYICRYFRAPFDLASTVYLSWLSQAEALRHGMEHWRRHRGRCMGSVYWQLNDNWPVASWSSIDSRGRWKALHYQARRSYAPIVVSTQSPEKLSVPQLPLPEGNGHFSPQPALVEIHVSNESRMETTGTLSWELLGCDGVSLEQGTQALSTSAFTSGKALTLDLSQRIQGREPPRQCLLSYRLELQAGLELSGFHHFVPFKQLALEPAELKAILRTGSDGSLTIEVTASKPALFVEIDHAVYDLVLSDNFLFLDGRRPRRLMVERCSKDGVACLPTAAELETGLILRSLRNSWI